MLAGAVLAGGRSRRMGRDKARIAWQGQPLWRRQMRILELAGADPVRLVLRRRQRSLGAPARELRDLRPDSGPLAGLEAALLALPDCAWVAVLAVDLPRIDSRWFTRLRRRCRPGVGVIARDAHGFEPLAAIYPQRALGVIGRRLGEGRLALQGLVSELVRRRWMISLRLSAADRRRLVNWNEPGDLGRASKRSSRNS